MELKTSEPMRRLEKTACCARCEGSRKGERMRALKLVQHMKANAGRMSEEVIQKIRASDRCRKLFVNVPAEEHTQYALDIYSDLTAWLATETESSIEERYVALGRRRAEQSVPFSELFWAVCIANEHLWEYLDIDDPSADRDHPAMDCIPWLRFSDSVVVEHWNDRMDCPRISGPGFSNQRRHTHAESISALSCNG
jgi:hypothetical protein